MGGFGRNGIASEVHGETAKGARRRVAIENRQRVSSFGRQGGSMRLVEGARRRIGEGAREAGESGTPVREGTFHGWGVFISN